MQEEVYQRRSEEVSQRRFTRGGVSEEVVRGGVSEEVYQRTCIRGGEEEEERRPGLHLKSNNPSLTRWGKTIDTAESGVGRCFDPFSI